MPAKQPTRGASTAKTTSPSTLHEALQLAASAATTRASEATQLFAQAADMLDEHHDSDSAKALPLHMKKAFKAFNDDVALVAKRHFDAYIRGNPRPPTPYTVDPNTPVTPPDSVPELPTSTPSRGRSRTRSISSPRLYSPPTTYAQAVAAPSSILKSHAGTRSTNKKKEPPKDNRIFVRLPHTHQARQIPGFTMLAALRQKLPDIAQYVQEIQPIKSGFALRPTTPEGRAALEACIPTLTEFYGEDCLVEKAVIYTSYRISNVPRRIAVLNEDNNLEQVDITAEMLSTAIKEASGMAPAATTQTPASAAAPQDYSSSWITRLPSNSPKLARSIILFGMQASTKLLPPRTTIIQCRRCFLWHNDRACARAVRCRLCGSTEHTEPDHPTCNNSVHDCPPRCIHCHGPHPADAAECLLRPNSKGTKLTKQQTSYVRQTCGAARLSICSINCKPMAPIATEDPMDTLPTVHQRSPTPEPSQSPTCPTTPTRSLGTATRSSTRTRATRFNSPSVLSSLSSLHYPNES